MPDSFNDNSAVFGGLLTVHFLLTKDDRKVETSVITNGVVQDPDKADWGNGKINGIKNGIENENYQSDQQTNLQVNYSKSLINVMDVISVMIGTFLKI